MSKRHKRGTDHKWQLVKYNGDIAIYARCKCGYRYNCSKSDGDNAFKQIPYLYYQYCPVCGARKKFVTEEIMKIDKYSWE